MSKFVKLTIDATKLLGVCLKAILKGDDKIILNLNPVTKENVNAPDYSNDLAAVWINESKF